MPDLAYKRPPIQEAILDVRVKLPSSVGLAELSAFGERYSKVYPIRKDRQIVQGKLEFNSGDNAMAASGITTTHLGYLYLTDDGRRAMQVRLDGFSYNRLPIYSGWAVFSSEARELWEAYLHAFSPEAINGVSLRYINRIVIPLEARLEDYCNLFLSESVMPKYISNYLMTYTAPSPSVEGRAATVAVTLSGEIEIPGKQTLILDITCAQNLPDSFDVALLWDVFSELRNEKNFIFEQSVTEKARSTFAL